MKTKIFLFLLLSVTIISCSSGNKKDADKKELDKTETISEMDDVSIENTKWIITKLDGGDMTDREVNGQEIFFTLDTATKRISGNSGCNTFIGTYELDGNKITFSQLASTKMMCPDSKINESQIVNIFDKTTSFIISDEQLIVYNADNEIISEFKKAEMTASIVEKYWKLIKLDGQEVKMTDNQEREIFFTLKSQDNRVTGFAGCNSISGEYTLQEGNRIRFSNIATTLKMCPDVAVSESELLNVFNTADNYTIVDDVLSLNIGKRAPLAIFEAVYMQ